MSEISRFYRFSLNLDDYKTVTLTFDDGYLNQVETAAPYLTERGIPAYLFVSGQLLPQTGGVSKQESGRPLVVDLLLHWISYVPSGEYQVDMLVGGAICKLRMTIGRRYGQKSYGQPLCKMCA